MNWDREQQQNGKGGDIHWQYFINPDKSASNLFDELCRGLAQIIRRLEPVPSHSDLTPGQMSNFYRSCGGNYDELFKNTGEHGISWIYRTMGCYHSLQPSKNAFEAPSIPCLTEDGYVRWQTLQLLLCPQEHVGFIQKAVELYDVPRKAGGFFPKIVPVQCFPQRADPDMEKWHRFVTSQINQEGYMRRLKFSPYSSPQPDAANSPGGYFSRTAPGRGPSQSRRGESLSEEELARRAAIRRRSSVPDVVSPGGTPITEREAALKARSRSANRPTSGSRHQRQRSGPSTPMQQPPQPGHRSSTSVDSRRHASNSSLDRTNKKREHRHDRNISSGSRPDSADDASSEESYRSRKQRSSEEDSSKRRPRWGSSLMPSFFLSRNQRRHSSDGRVPTLDDNRRSPKRGDSIKRYKTEGPAAPTGRYIETPPDRSSSGVRFNDVFKRGDAPPARPEEPAYAAPPTSYRFADTQPGVHQMPHTNPSPHILPNVNEIPPTPPSGGNSPHIPNYFAANPPQPNMRHQGHPIRLSTVSGVNGRRYAPPPPEARSGVEPSLTRRPRTSSMRNPATSTVI